MWSDLRNLEFCLKMSIEDGHFNKVRNYSLKTLENSFNNDVGIKSIREDLAIIEDMSL